LTRARIFEAERYAVRMNIAVSRAFGALRVVASRREVERDPVLRGIDKMYP